MRARWLVIGVGNRDRGDDAVGPIVCDRLAALRLPGVETEVVETGGIDLVTAWQPGDDVTIVDASQPAGRPGHITEIDALHDHVESSRALSTHAVDIPTAIGLARAIGSLPAALTLTAIEAEQFDYGRPLSDAVHGAADHTVDRFRRLTDAAALGR